MNRRNPVVLLYGMGDTSVLFDRLCRFLEERGRTTHRFDLVPGNGDAGLDLLARQVDSYIERTFGGEQRVDLVGFSMGGIVARYYLQRLGGLARASRLVTIGSPQCGTWTAYLRRNPGARQLRPGSDFLRNLDTDRHVLSGIRFTTIWTPWDLMVVPPASSVIPEARAVRVNVPVHALMMRDRRVHRLVEQALSER